MILGEIWLIIEDRRRLWLKNAKVKIIYQDFRIKLWSYSIQRYSISNGTNE